jgi:hypothetical protein
MMKSAVIRNVILAGAVLALPLRATAQQNTGIERMAGAEQIDTVRRESRMHLGPLYMTPTIALKELGVDSNVFNAAGEQKSDFTFTLGPKMHLWVPVARRALFQGTAATDLVWYAQYDSERSVDPQFTGRGEIYVRRITLFAESRYLNSRQRLNYEVDLRARHVSSGFGGGLGVRLTPKFSVEAEGHQDEIKFEADSFFDGASLQRMLNQRTTGLTLSARHKVTPLSTLVLRTERLEDEFPFSPARDSRSIRVMPGVEFKPRALIKGSAFVGYRRFTPSQIGALPEFSGIIAELGLSYAFLGSTSVGVTYTRDLTYSYEELQPFFINNSVGASVRRALGRRFDVELGTTRNVYDYKNLLTTGVSLAERQDVNWRYSGGVGYIVGQGRIGVGMSYWQRDSTSTSRDTNNLRFGTTVTYGF